VILVLKNLSGYQIGKRVVFCHRCSASV
jgi:hypothetical protein